MRITSLFLSRFLERLVQNAMERRAEYKPDVDFQKQPKFIAQLM